MAEAESWYPTVCFGLFKIKGKDILHQMWVDQWGHVDWRPVPMMGEVNKTRTPSVAGYIPAEEEGNDDEI